MTARARLLDLAARCERRQNNLLRLSDILPLLDALRAEEARGGPLPDHYGECAAALRARAEEVTDEG